MENKVEKRRDMDKLTDRLCACGCGSRVQVLPYKVGDKEYASAYCILREAKCCSYCGGYNGTDPVESAESDYVCTCNFKELDGSY